jgi:hypothetical protein
VTADKPRQKFLDTRAKFRLLLVIAASMLACVTRTYVSATFANIEGARTNNNPK